MWRVETGRATSAWFSFHCFSSDASFSCVEISVTVAVKQTIQAAHLESSDLVIHILMVTFLGFHFIWRDSGLISEFCELALWMTGFNGLIKCQLEHLGHDFLSLEQIWMIMPATEDALGIVRSTNQRVCNETRR